MSGRGLRLENLGYLRGGYATRTARQDHDGPGRVPALQARDLREDGSVAWSELGWIEVQSVPEKYVLADGDVLLPLRSVSSRAMVVRKPPARVVAMGPWALLSSDRSIARPEFVAWYLNHPVTAVRLNRLAKGTKLRFLSLTNIRNLEMEVPSLSAQHRITQVHMLNQRVAGLERKIMAARKQLVDARTMGALHGTTQTNTEDG